MAVWIRCADHVTPLCRPKPCRAVAPLDFTYWDWTGLLFAYPGVPAVTGIAKCNWLVAANFYKKVIVSFPEINWRRLSRYLVLWPARATTKKFPCGATTPLGRACRMGVPERGGGNEADYCLNDLAVATSPIGRKHQHVLQITLYY